MRRLLPTLCACLALAGCGSPRRGEPLAGAVPSDEIALERGRAVFMQNCYACHPGGEAGLGPALNNRPWPDFVKRRAIRRGEGPMPAFSTQEISDAALKDLLTYLAALRGYYNRSEETVRPTRQEEP